MSDTKFFGSPFELMSRLMADDLDLQARVQELEDMQPSTRIAALEAKHDELLRRIAALEQQRGTGVTTKANNKRA